MLLSNAFSINMLQSDCSVNFTELGPIAAASYLVVDGIENAIGHPDTDAVVRSIIGDNSSLASYQIPVGQRISVSLQKGQKMIVAQYTGPRLPEGATSLPEGATIKWWLVEVN